MNAPRQLKVAEIAVCLLLALPCSAATAKEHAGKIAPLIQPAKLATLGTRGANPRVQKVTHWLAVAKEDKASPVKVASEAARLAGYKGDAAKLAAEAMTRNLSIAEKLGCITPSGLEDMRRGHAPTVWCLSWTTSSPISN